MQKLRIVILLSISTLSCNSHYLDKIAKEKKEHESLKIQIIDSLALEYSVSYLWDTLDAHDRRHLFTVDLVPVMKSIYQIIGDPEIIDIYERDSLTHASIVTGVYGSFYMDLIINAKQQKQLVQPNKEFIMLVSVPEVKRINYVIRGNLRDKQTDVIDLNLRHPAAFLGQGTITKIISVNSK